MWNEVIKQYSEAMPKFNDDLLIDFRERKIKDIAKYLDEVFQEIVKMFRGELKYTAGSYTSLTPSERINHIMTDKILKRKMEIQESSMKILAFEFIFQDRSYLLHVPVPYLDPYAITLSGTKYYPQFPIVEKGLHRIKDGVLVKVMRAPLNFWKREDVLFATTDGKTYREQVLTVKIHQGEKKSKKTEKTPLILYHLVVYGLNDTLHRYGFTEDEFNIVTEPVETDGYKFIKITPKAYIKVNDSVFDDRFKRRFIGSMIVILKYHKRYNISDLYDPKGRYFKVVLGKYNQPYHSKDGILFSQAEKHLESNSSLLDIIAKKRLHHVGIDVNSIEELLFEAYYNLDQWLLNYRPNDLYDKRIGGLDQMVEELIRSIVTVAYRTTNNKQGLNHQSITKFTKSASKPRWFANSSMFRSSPQLFNDNWLLSIGSKRFRSVDNPTAKPFQKSKGKTMPIELIKAHPSHMVVESILTIPSSNPIVSGSINPYCQIDEDGNIIKPDYAETVDNIFN